MERALAVLAAEFERDIRALKGLEEALAALPDTAAMAAEVDRRDGLELREHDESCVVVEGAYFLAFFFTRYPYETYFHAAPANVTWPPGVRMGELALKDDTVANAATMPTYNCFGMKRDGTPYCMATVETQWKTRLPCSDARARAMFAKEMRDGYEDPSFPFDARDWPIFSCMLTCFNALAV